MLVITRRPGERVMIGDDIVIAVIDVKGANVRIGIEAPREIAVFREELLDTRGDTDPARAPEPGSA